MTPSATTHPPQSADQRRAAKRAFAGSIAGHLIEWYDYGVYGYLAIYMGAAFFPSDDPLVSILSSFAVFALSFFIRPIGGLFFGPLADRIGRRRTLLIVLTVMASSTFLIGLLPTYAAIGVAAPLLLVLIRCVQGFSAGGEVGTVASFIAEHANGARRGFATSWLLAISAAGLVIGALVVNGLILWLGNETMAEGGWRIPFLIAGPLGLLTLWLRLRLEDSPAFLRIQEQSAVAKSPLRDALAQPRALLLVFGVVTLATSSFYLVLTYYTTLMRTALSLDESTVFFASIGAALLAGAFMPVGGMVSDRFGRRRPMIAYAVIAIALCLAVFFAAATASIPLFLFFAVALAIVSGLYGGSVYALMSELLPTRIRATGLAISYNVPVALFGGSAPFLSTLLISTTGSLAAPGYYFAATGVISLITLFLIRPRDQVGIDA